MTEFKVRTNGSYEMEVMDRELSARRWLTELCFNAQKELKLTHWQIGYLLLEKAHLELSLARLELEKTGL